MDFWWHLVAPALTVLKKKLLKTFWNSPIQMDRDQFEKVKFPEKLEKVCSLKNILEWLAAWLVDY